jgi:hypothetical protein
VDEKVFQHGRSPRYLNGRPPPVVRPIIKKQKRMHDLIHLNPLRSLGHY